MRVFTTPGCDRDIRRLAPAMMARVLAAIVHLAADQRPPGCRLLRDWRPPTWRLRVGDYRIFYQIDDAAGIVTVTGVRRRDEAYRAEG